MVDSHHPLLFGRAGVYGQRYSNFIVQNSDLVICIGTRMAYPQVGYDINEFARDSKIVAVDIDQKELDKFSERITLPICADAGDFIESVLYSPEYDNSTKFEEWHKQCVIYRKDFPIIGERA